MIVVSSKIATTHAKLSKSISKSLNLELTIGTLARAEIGLDVITSVTCLRDRVRLAITIAMNFKFQINFAALAVEPRDGWKLKQCTTKIANCLTALETQTFPGCVLDLTACAPFRGAAAGQTDSAVAELS